MKRTAVTFLGLWVLLGVAGLEAAEPDAEQRGLVCDDLLIELAQPLPAASTESAPRDLQSVLEPLYSMEKNKLTLLAVFGFSLTLMMRVLCQMWVKARRRQMSTHSCSLHSHPSNRTHSTPKKKNRTLRTASATNAFRYTLAGMQTSVEQFHLNTMCERRPKYTRHYKRFAHAPSY